MSNEIWKNPIISAINEAYDGTGGTYLDQGTDTLAELRSLSGAQASVVVPGANNSVANQVKHLLTCAVAYQSQFNATESPSLDWGADWEAVSLSDEEWAQLVDAYEASQEQSRQMIESNGIADEAEKVAAAISLVTHLAYHTGQIRHAIAYARQN